MKKFLTYFSAHFTQQFTVLLVILYILYIYIDILQGIFYQLFTSMKFVLSL
jgi:hypothetical protein